MSNRLSQTHERTRRAIAGIAGECVDRGPHPARSALRRRRPCRRLRRTPPGIRPSGADSPCRDSSGRCVACGIRVCRQKATADATAESPRLPSTLRGYRPAASTRRTRQQGMNGRSGETDIGAERLRGLGTAEAHSRLSRDSGKPLLASRRSRHRFIGICGFGIADRPGRLSSGRRS